jgi:hypothetical protein
MEGGVVVIRKVAEFYLWGMGLSFIITLWIGANGAEHFDVFLFAMLAWPLSFLLLVVKTTRARLRQHELSAAA